MSTCRATQKIPFLPSAHGHLPSPRYKIIFPDQTGFSYLLSKAIHAALQKTYTLSFESKCECVTACILSSCFILSLLRRGLGGRGKSVNKSIEKIYNINWIMTALYTK